MELIQKLHHDIQQHPCLNVTVDVDVADITDIATSEKMSNSDIVTMFR